MSVEHEPQLPEVGGLVAALGGAWAAIRARHHDVPAVMLVFGTGANHRAARCKLGHFAPALWLPVHEGEPAEPQAEPNAVDDDLMAQLAASAQRMVRHAMLLSWEAAASLSEVLITADGLAGSAADVIGILVPWRRGRIQTLGMPSSDRASTCSACWNVGNPKGCQSDVGNLDGCPHRVISTGGYWMWNPNAAATATSMASKMMNIISANGIEPAADFRRALGERKRDSALPLVVRSESGAHHTRLADEAAAVPACAGLVSGYCL